ncbi:hypothetical protein QZH41_007916 [Actinostola sp. cb2023]|nr:hypothetical protein QZH41_007916 [Actinostola sp. cb2023]
MGEGGDCFVVGKVGRPKYSTPSERVFEKKTPIWLEISRYLKASGYEDREYDSCKTRLHTLVSTYRGYKDACNKTGNATPKKQPPFYKELDDILADKPSTRPAVLINSIQMATTTSAEAMDDDIDRDDLSFDDCERDENQLDDENSSCVEGLRPGMSLKIHFCREFGGDNEYDHERDYKSQINRDASEVKGQVQLSN